MHNNQLHEWQQYVIDGQNMSINQICKMFNVTEQCIRMAIKHFYVECRKLTSQKIDKTYTNRFLEMYLSMKKHFSGNKKVPRGTYAEITKIVLGYKMVTTNENSEGKEDSIVIKVSQLDEESFKKDINLILRIRALAEYARQQGFDI